MSARAVLDARAAPILGFVGFLSRREDAPDSGNIKEGGYQPTSDPGPVPAALVRDVPAVARAIAHEDRLEILRSLSEREGTPREFVNMLGKNLGVVSMHFKVLIDTGAIELVRSEPRRGAIEHYYRVSEQLLPVVRRIAPPTPGIHG